MPSNYGAGADSWESLGQQGNHTNLKGNQPWILIERTDPEAETPVFWSSDANSWLIGKVPDAGEDWWQKKRASEDEMAGWHHWCNGHELGQTSGGGEGQEGLVCCSPWDHKVSDVTGQLNTTTNYMTFREWGLYSVCQKETLTIVKEKSNIIHILLVS